MAKKKRRMQKSAIARELFSPLYKPKTEAKQKGKGSFNRKKDEKNLKEQLKSCSFYFGSHQKSVSSCSTVI